MLQGPYIQFKQASKKKKKRKELFTPIIGKYWEEMVETFRVKIPK